MEHVLDVPECLSQDLPVPCIAHDHLEPAAVRRTRPRSFGRRLEIAQRARGQIVQHPYRGAFIQQLVDEMRSHEPRAAGYEYGAHLASQRVTIEAWSRRYCFSALRVSTTSFARFAIIALSKLVWLVSRSTQSADSIASGVGSADASFTPPIVSCGMNGSLYHTRPPLWAIISTISRAGDSRMSFTSAL